MQSKSSAKPTKDTHTKLFPDLAPYGEIRPQLKSIPEHEQSIEKPRVFKSQPTISERQLSSSFHAAPAVTPNTETHITTNYERHMHRSRWRLLITIGIATILFVGILFGGWFHFYRSINPIPTKVTKLVSFPIYYPDQKKLPAGYTLDHDSFHSPIENGIGYTVGYGDNQKIVFSVQTAPSDSDIQAFNASYIPAHTDYQTPLGLAQIGTFKTQILVSLPIKNGSWVVMTARPDIDQDKLKAVMRSLRK